MRARGSSLARAMAMLPLPVPTSRMVSRSREESSRTFSTRTSVSGRGMRTEGETPSGMDQNSRVPVR